MSNHGLINLGGNTLREKPHEPCACGIQIGALRSVNNYAGSSNAIGDYEITEIQVQKQKNKYVSPHSSSSFFLFDSHFFFTHPY